MTPQVSAATNAVDAARERLALRMFRNWSCPDYDQILRLTRMLADGLDDAPAAGSKLAESMAQEGASPTGTDARSDRRTMKVIYDSHIQT
ncbi:hypothetical protein [Granulicella arctica]|uniref:hypothetical protein n=1 Tax=Granulicella arctica TaxID=940613 RepID=UPI0021DFA12E|nr:hypothetical protein [Granulicella arctica]